MSYVIKHRRAGRGVLSVFECEQHGRFSAYADADAESAPCPAKIRTAPLDLDRYHLCAKPSEWRPTPVRFKFAIEAVRGKPEAPEHKGWLDTSNLEEGQDPEEFAADREKVHEELRKELVTEMVRTDR